MIQEKRFGLIGPLFKSLVTIDNNLIFVCNIIEYIFVDLIRIFLLKKKLAKNEAFSHIVMKLLKGSVSL